MYVFFNAIFIDYFKISHLFLKYQQVDLMKRERKIVTFKNVANVPKGSSHLLP